jgi:hypothetical protein
MEKPLEVEELSAGEVLEEIEDLAPSEEIHGHAAPSSHTPTMSSVEVPIVLDRSLFTGEAPVEIKLKLYIK